MVTFSICCIFLSSYIKPQPKNRIRRSSCRCIFLSSYIKPQPGGVVGRSLPVVSSYHPTSNRNLNWFLVFHAVLYLLIILHQTATPIHSISQQAGCIFLSSYIKPQLYVASSLSVLVVSSYHPTSNRNLLIVFITVVLLYLLIILHQTATIYPCYGVLEGLYLLIILHQTATFGVGLGVRRSLYLLIILHQTAT